jgi:hypothetical protein
VLAEQVEKDPVCCKEAAAVTVRTTGLEVCGCVEGEGCRCKAGCGCGSSCGCCYAAPTTATATQGGEAAVSSN